LDDDAELISRNHVCFSDMRIKRLTVLTLLPLTLSAWSATAAPMDLFNGKDFTGWTQRGGKATYALKAMKSSALP
jgi:hypothetical protein